MGFIEQVLYMMMEERVSPGIYKSTFEDMRKNLEFTKLTEEELKKYLYMAVAQGYVERLDDYYQMTEKAKKYIAYRES